MDIKGKGRIRGWIANRLFKNIGTPIYYYCNEDEDKVICYPRFPYNYLIEPTIFDR